MVITRVSLRFTEISIQADFGGVKLLVASTDRNRLDSGE